MENKLNNKTFIYDLKNPKILEELMHARVLVQKFNNIPVNKEDEKKAILSELFGYMGDECNINPNFYCDFGSHIYIGNNFFCNYNCTILDIADVHIGDNCLFAPNVSLYTASHPLELSGRLDDKGVGIPITIGNGVWIGGNSVILGGVEIGDNAVIGAGSVVTRDVPKNAVFAGNPAKFIRYIMNAEQLPSQ